MRAVVGILALLGRVAIASAEPVAPAPVAAAPWLGHITMHHGIGLADDGIDDEGASSPGAVFGFQLGGQYRIAPSYSIGAAIDLNYGMFSSDAEAGAKANYLHYFPTAVARYELGRFAAVSWAGFHFGHRSITAPGGVLGSDKNLSSDDIRGPVVAGGFVVRFALPTPQPVTLEFGPFVQASWLVADDGSVRSVVFGLVSQVVYNGPPIP